MGPPVEPLLLTEAKFVLSSVSAFSIFVFDQPPVVVLLTALICYLGVYSNPDINFKKAVAMMIIGFYTITGVVTMADSYLNEHGVDYVPIETIVLTVGFLVMYQPARVWAAGLLKGLVEAIFEGLSHKYGKQSKEDNKDA